MDPRFFQPLWDLMGIRGWNSYTVFEFLTLFLAYPLVYLVTRHIVIERWKMFLNLSLMFYAGICGSKLFHILFDEQLSRFIGVIRNAGFLAFLRQEFLYPWKGGQVFYGGILTAMAAGTLFGWFLFRKDRKLNILRTYDIIVFVFYEISAVGRIGCFLQGCCYGAISETFGLVFPGRSAAASGLYRDGLLESSALATPPLIPTQLIEVCTSGSILIFLLVKLPKAKQLWTGYYAWHALMFHAIARFCIEFLRIDRRGGLWLFSTSQWIAITVATVLIIIRIRMLRKQRTIEASHV
ncbi:MAG TPA: prolipoprotein diacylglyceryl transferase [bacterium]|nr:prolipoprotein diacylglyceryl transferase [bacterium]